MEKELFDKFINNRCSEKELEDIVNLIQNDTLNLAWKKEGLEEWQKRHDKQHLNDSETNSLLDKIHHRININNQRHLSFQGNSKISIFISYLTKAAAILLLPVLTFLFFTISKNSIELEKITNLTADSIEIVSPIGSRSEIQLSDGSMVFLNHGSRLKYPQKFYGDTREVILSGEGYFKVAHDPENPFVVKTRGLNIKAIGTEFNVLAYPDENNIETTLVKGKVEIEKRIKNGQLKKLGAMIPGQHVNYNYQTEKISSEVGDIEKYVSWKDGKLVFKNESIVNIVSKLSRWYNVDFEFNDKESMEYTYTATFVDENVFQILDLMKLVTPINYKVTSRKKLPDGTFSKQKISIEKSANYIDY